MIKIQYDKYYKYAEITDILQSILARYPNLVRLSSIGKSFEGRDIWLLSITNYKTGEAHEKPAFWVDGNIHATELASSMACLYFIDWLINNHGLDQDVTRCLDTRVFYICPRLNPDGAERALADKPNFLRSSTRTYPDSVNPGGIVISDIDGDGRVLSIRIPDSNGPWKISDQDSRLLVRREPTESGERYYRLIPEGYIEDFDGVTLRKKIPKEGLDLNRNYPAGWRQEHEQPGSGPFPASEPEVHAAVAFITSHSNITGGISFHTYSGVLLRPYTHFSDDSLPAEDLWAYQLIGAKGTEITGYPNISIFHDFRYHPQETISGTIDNWLYDHLGCFAWTVEIWSPHEQAGITNDKFLNWYREHPVEDDFKLLKWNDEKLDGKGFVDWYPFVHPQLGPVEIGGWDVLYTWRNPPPNMLESEIRRFPKWLVWHLLISPKLELIEASAVSLGNCSYKIRLVVQNTGWLPTYITKRALTNKLTLGVVCEIDFPRNCKLIAGEKRVVHGQLEGRAHKPTSALGYVNWDADPTDDRLKIEWVIDAPCGTLIKLIAKHARTGTVSAELLLT
ncbi:MAG: M14 family metallopeptidase [Candidatus Nitrotoga sp.]|nr:M14 family metallopeptidase [Candidatus Nitrotoga sp.]